MLKKLLLGDSALHDLAVIGIVVGSIGTVAYTAKFFFGCFAGAPRSVGADDAHGVDLEFIAAPLLLAVSCLLGGVGAVYIDRWILEPMTASLLGHALEAPQLRLWHGINVPLIVSGAILTSGFVLFRRVGLRSLAEGPASLAGPRLFERALEAAQSLGGWVNRVLAGGRPTVYFALLLVLGFAWAAPLVRGITDVFTHRWQPSGAFVVVLLAVALALLIRLPSKVGRILALSAVGFAVAMLYGMLNAPDLVLTQLLVEVLSSVFFLMAVRFVADREPSPAPSRAVEAVRITFAVSIGLLSLGLVVALQRVPASTRISDYYFAAGPALAEGKNLVNLVLADFRGLDTLVEPIVVVITGLGVVALMRGREVFDSPERSERR